MLSRVVAPHKKNRNCGCAIQPFPPSHVIRNMKIHVYIWRYVNLKGTHTASKWLAYGDTRFLRYEVFWTKGLRSCCSHRQDLA
jgi:hypothetical protein